MDKYEIRRLNLIKIKNEYCGGKIALLADKLDKSPSYISRLLYEKGKANKKNIADRVTTDIEQAFNLPRGWLDGLTNNEPVKLSKIRERSELTELRRKSEGVKIEVLDVQASSGNGSIIAKEFDNVLRSIEFTQEFAMKLFGRRKAQYIKVITAKGDSMSPTIRSGANIFVDTNKNYFDGDGVYVFIFDNEIYIKRIQVTGTEIVVISDNPVYEKWRVEKHFIDRFYIQGKVFIGQNIDYVYFD